MQQTTDTIGGYPVVVTEDMPQGVFAVHPLTWATAAFRLLRLLDRHDKVDLVKAPEVDKACAEVARASCEHSGKKIFRPIEHGCKKFAWFCECGVQLE